MIKLITRKLIVEVIIYFVFFVSLLTFIVVPITGDIKVFLASANQSNFISDNLILGSYQAWELKGVFSRLLMYLIYKVATLFVSFSTYAFECTISLIYAVMLIVIITASITMSFEHLTKREKILYSFGLSSIVMCGHTATQMQVEMTVVLLCIFSLAIYISSIKKVKYRKCKLFFIGIIIGSIFFFKSILILMSVSIVAAGIIYCMQNNYSASIKHLLIIIAGSITMLISNSILISIINPLEFADMIYASSYQSTLLSLIVEGQDISLIGVAKNLIVNYLNAIKSIPILILGLICLGLNIKYYVLRKKWSLIFYHIILWIMPSLFIVISNRYFVYHYVIYVFPIIIEIYSILKKEKNHFENGVIYFGSMITILLFLVNFSLFSRTFAVLVENNKNAYMQNEVVLDGIEWDDKKILYLDDGAGAYYLGQESYSRYFFPLPLQRLEEGSELEIYNILLEEILAFNGTYISVHESWFFGKGNNQIKKKLEKEYKYLTSYNVFSPPFFSYTNKGTIRVYDIYIKKF